MGTQQQEVRAILLELSGPLICEFRGFSYYSNRADNLSVFLYIDNFLFRHYCFYFKFLIRLSRRPSSNHSASRSHLCSSHFFAIAEFKSCIILIILSAVSTFMLSKRVKIFVSVIRKIFRFSPKLSLSI